MDMPVGVGESVSVVVERAGMSGIQILLLLLVVIAILIILIKFLGVRNE